MLLNIQFKTGPEFADVYDKDYGMKLLNDDCDYILWNLYTNIKFFDAVDNIMDHIWQSDYEYHDFYTCHNYNALQYKCIFGHDENECHEYSIYCNFAKLEHPWEIADVKVADDKYIDIILNTDYIDLFKNPDDVDKYKDESGEFQQKIKKILSDNSGAYSMPIFFCVDNISLHSWP